MLKTPYFHELERDPILGPLFATYATPGSGVETRCRACDQGWVAPSREVEDLAREHAARHSFFADGCRFYFAMQTTTPVTAKGCPPSWSVVACRRCHAVFRLAEGEGGHWTGESARWAAEHAGTCGREAEASRLAAKLMEILGAHGEAHGSVQDPAKLQEAFQSAVLEVLR